MRSIVFRVLILVFIITVGCQSSKEASNVQSAKTDNTVLRNSGVDVYLSDMLRRIPGVHVRGKGANAVIRVRGGSGSLVSSNDPLFILDEQIIQGGYATVVNSIDPTQVKSIEVLKDAGSLSSYGSRGANGVIKIMMK